MPEIPNMDTALAILSSLLAWYLFLPFIFTLSKVNTLFDFTTSSEVLFQMKSGIGSWRCHRGKRKWNRCHTQRLHFPSHEFSEHCRKKSQKGSQVFEPLDNIRIQGRRVHSRSRSMANFVFNLVARKIGLEAPDS